MAFLEDGSMKLSDNTFVQRANAVDFVSRYPIVRGKNLGILLGSSGSELNRPLQEYYDPLSFTGIDITSYTGSLGSASGFGPLKAVVSNTEVFIGTGRTITGIETNYRGTMDIVTSTCPSGWNPSNKTLK